MQRAPPGVFDGDQWGAPWTSAPVPFRRELLGTLAHYGNGLKLLYFSTQG
jgi:hypothetical protein